MHKPLSQFADIHYGKSPSEVVAIEGVVPVYGTGGAYERATRALFNGPAVVVPRKGSLGNPHYVEGLFWPSDTTYAVMPKAGVDARWLFLQLSLFDLTKLNEATGVPSISRDWLAKVPIFEHQDLEQTASAHVVFGVVAQIAQTRTLIAKQERIRAGLLQDLFTRGVDQNGALRLPREEAPDLYHQTELGWLPKRWEIGKLNSLVQVIDCKHFTPKYTTEGYPVVRPRNVKLTGLDLIEVDFVSDVDFRALTDTHKPTRGDIVFSRNASFGVACRVETDLEFAIGQDVIVMAPKGIALDYVFWALRSDWIRAQIARVSSGSTFGRINLAEIRALRIPNPVTADERSAIVECLNRVDDTVRALTQSTAKLYQQRAALMQDLLTGRVSVAPLLQAEAA